MTTPLVTLTIDGKQIQAPEGLNLLQAARENGIDIPGLCYHHKISPTGACRLCVTKIEGRNGLVMACTIGVADGMTVTAFDAELEATRRHTLDYLLAEHNESDDGTYADEFRELVVRYGLSDPEKRTYPNIHKEMGYPVDDTSPILTYDASKCIKCFRCIKACDEVQGKNVLSFADRGITSHIVAGFGKWDDSECDGCGECIQLCPTGALVEKPHRDQIRMDRVEKRVRTTCPYCGVGCQISLHVQDNSIVRATGEEGLSPNDGRLCVKGRFGLDYVQHPERLTTPLIRKNGVLVETGWDEALNLIAEKFSGIKQNAGSDALAGYASAKCTNEDNYLFQKLVRTVFGTNNVDYCTRLCHASTVTAMLKSIGDGAGSNSIEDFATTDCLFVTGNNMVETHPVTATYVKAGKAKGNRLIVCDPKWTPLAAIADIWLQPRLGSDVALFNGMIRHIIKSGLMDEDFITTRVDGGKAAVKKLEAVVAEYTGKLVEKITGVPETLMKTAADIYAAADTAIIATGMGLSQHTTGTHNVFALINMMLITGQIGKERAGIDPPRGQNNVQGATDVGCSPLFYPGYIPVTDEVNRKRMAGLWAVEHRALSIKPGLTTVEIINKAHSGEIKGMYIMGENPMITDPDLNHTEQALRNLDFLVVQDIFPTPTTEIAHVVLPAFTFAEKEGTFVNSDRRVLRVRKAVEAPVDTRDDWRIIMDIARHMGHDIGTYDSAAEIFDEIAQAAPMMRGISYERLETAGIQWPCPNKDHPGTGTLFLDRFNTPNGKGILHPVAHTPPTEKPTEIYPFLLNSGRILYHYHSATMTRRSKPLSEFADAAYVLMHPVDAGKYGFSDGDRVTVTSAQGELETTLSISTEVAETELFMPWHFAESPVNRLTRNDLDPFSKIAPFKLTACRVERAKE
ncbi:MAG: formate dehydrogenase subunit alpha [Desulfobacteraceae bacterium]|nr:formate dehydrogenase subunit alpha [Desulfobacteraceae bacterium]